MSRKCWRTAFSMDTSRKSAPSSWAIFWALDLVRPVVPKQGMDTAWTPFRSRPRLSKARTVTSSARVESKPPDRPITADLQPMWESLVARPWACMVKISWQRLSSPAWSWGTKGVLAKARRGWKRARVSSSYRKGTRTTAGSRCSCQVFIRRRSWASRSRSMSAVTRPWVKSWLSPSTVPFSAIRSWPAKTMSVVDSPGPASA